MKRFVALVFVVVCLAACQKAPFLSMTGSKTFTFNRDGGTQIIGFSCNRDWSVSCSESWIRISPSSGMASDGGDISVTITCSPNNTYDARTATVTVKVEGLTETISVSQATGQGLIVSPISYELPYTGQTIEIEVQQNVKYSIEIDDTCKDWIKMGGTKALTTDKVGFIISENTSFESREGKIAFKQIDGPLMETVTIKQAPIEGEERDRRALIAFYHALNGDNWKHKDNWCSDAPLKEWYGVGTDLYSGAVTSIMLEDNNLHGAITTELIFPLKDLIYLFIQNNVITDINLDGCNLEHLIADSIPAKQVKLTNMPDLCTFAISGELERIDLSGTSNMDRISLSDCPYLTGIELKDMHRLTGIFLDHDREITELDLSNCPLLEVLHINQCSLSSLDITHCPELTSLTAGLNKLSSLDLSNNPKLQTLWIGSNSLSEIVLGEKNELSQLLVGGNPMHSLDISGCPKLETLEISNTQIESIDVSGSPRLNKLLADYSNLSSISLKTCRELIEFSAINARLTSLDVSSCPQLTLLQPYGNPIKELDLSNNHLLEKLYCYNCSLSSLDLSHNNMLKELQCGKNPITKLDISNLPLLEVLYCGELQITELDIKSNYKLNMFNCSKNPSLKYIYIYPGQNVRMEQCGTDNNAVFVEEGTSPGLYYESTDYSQDRKVVELQKSTKGKGINMVIMGDGYSDRLIADGTYAQDMSTVFENLFSVEPMASFRDCFNISYVTAVSRNDVYEAGSSTCFSAFFTGGSYIVGDNEKIFQYACESIPEESLPESVVIVIVNSTKTAGIAYLYGDGSAIAYVPKCPEFRDVLVHESVGHAFAKLADEYSSGWGESINEFPSDLEELRARFETGFGVNVDLNSDPEAVKWSRFLKDSRYAAENLGVYQGAYGFDFDVYRPSWHSVMRSDGSTFNAPSREAIYKRIHQIAYGEQWEYDYETFVQYDIKNVPSSQQGTKSGAGRPGFVRIDNGPIFVPGDRHTTPRIPSPKLKSKK